MYTDESFLLFKREVSSTLMVVKKKDGYYVQSKKGRNLGGPYGSRLAALRRLRQVEAFKNK